MLRFFKVVLFFSRLFKGVPIICFKAALEETTWEHKEKTTHPHPKKYVEENAMFI